MNIQLHTFEELPHILQQQLAEEISAETYSQFSAEQKIVPTTPESILQREVGLVALQNGLLTGYVGATKLNEDHTQIGTLVVPEHSRGSGLGAQLVAGITELVTDADLQPFAFCNPSSQSSFQKAGYIPALPGEIPPEAQSRFNNQPMIHPSAMSEQFLAPARNTMALYGHRTRPGGIVVIAQ